MNDTSATIKLRWEETTVIVYEAEVPVDQLPDTLIETDDNSWTIAAGDVDSHEGNSFLEALVDSGAAIEQSTGVENRYISDDVELIQPIMIAAPPIPAGEVIATEHEYLGDLAERAEWRAELREEASGE